MKVYRWLTGIVFFCGIVLGCNHDFLFKDPGTPTASERHTLKSVSGNDKLDILWVIDNSRSMRPYQQAVEDNLDLFIKLFSARSTLDWRMGLISTDTTDDPYLGFTPDTLIDRNTPNIVDVFRQGIEHEGLNGDGIEKMFSPVDKALKAHPDFLRKSAILATILVSDAPEQSSLIGINEFLASLIEIKGDISKVVGYAAAGAQDFGCPPTDDYWLYQGSRYQKYINATHGRVVKLCSDHFGAELANIGDDLLKRVSSSRLQLQNRPIPSSIQVLFHGKPLPPGTKEQNGYWIYDAEQNAIIFNDLNFATGDNEDIEVTYQTS